MQTGPGPAARATRLGHTGRRTTEAELPGDDDTARLPLVCCRRRLVGRSVSASS